MSLPQPAQVIKGVSTILVGNKAPAFLFYAGDFLSSPDVSMMLAHEVGGYLLLLLYSWQSDKPGYLPNNEERMRRLSRLTPEQWKDSRDILLGKWPESDDGVWRYNPRLVREAEKQEANRKARVRAGNASAAKRTASASTAAEDMNPDESPNHRSSTEGKQQLNTNSTYVARMVNICSEKLQHKDNLSVSITPSLSIPSSLRSEGAAKAAKSRTRSNNKDSKSLPSLEEVQTYAAEKYPGSVAAQDEATAYFNYYESNGWLVGGKTPMKKWPSAFQSWMRRSPQFQFNSGYTASPAPTRASIAPRPAAISSYS